MVARRRSSVNVTETSPANLGATLQRRESLVAGGTEGTPTPAQPGSKTRRPNVALVLGDTLALLIGFVVPLVLSVEVGPKSLLSGLGEAVLLAAAGLWAMRLQGLWSPRIIAVRALELSRIGRAIGILSVFAIVLDRKSSMMIRGWDVLLAAVVCGVVIVAWRSVYRWYLAVERRNGRQLSRVVIIGTDSRSGELDRLFAVHPELGMRTVAVVGDRTQATRTGVGHRWAGELLDAGSVIERFEADAVVLCTGDLDPAVVHTLSLQAREQRRQVYVDPGLSRIDFRRMQATAWAHQPVFALEPTRLSLLELALKRTFDILTASIILLLSLPVTLAIAAAVKLGDGGPVFFRQQRVGQNGAMFGMIKFRTMVVDAEAKLAELERGNERKGPLFKMDRDPRITRIGHFLRASSLDELPQLINVLAGTMSIVGPRPALPKEVAAFPADLNARHLVRPGITGLWQTEARDNPDFDAYRRLDLFYVENWSLSLDMVIMLATADQIFLRPLFKKLGRPMATPATDADADAVTDEPAATEPAARETAPVTATATPATIVDSEAAA